MNVRATNQHTLRKHELEADDFFIIVKRIERVSYDAASILWAGLNGYCMDGVISTTFCLERTAWIRRNIDFYVSPPEERC